MPGADLDLLRGTLDLLVLRALRDGPQHGFGVARWLRQVTRDDLRIEDGALYTSLHRLEQRHLVKSEWRITENNRKARYYELTRAGREGLTGDAARWTTYATAIFRALGTRREAIRLLEQQG